MKTNKAKFFCENCGSEVPENAKVCKVCGKFFISVRCPQCGATGSHDEFADGCPKCGYAVGKNGKSNAGNKSGSSKEKKGLFSGKNSNIFRGFSSEQNNERREDSGLPFWVYIVTFAVFLGVLVAVFSCISKSPY